MPQPTAHDVHVNAPLTNISIAFLQNQDSFVASSVFPSIPVQKQSDRYYTYDRGDFNRDEMQLRAPGTESAGSGYSIDNTPTYFADVYAFHKDIPDQIRANADSVLQLDREATEYTSHKALIKKEGIFASQYMKSGVWTVDKTGVSASPTGSQFLQWNDAASTPIEDIRTEMTVQQKSTGFRPNTLVLTRPVFDTLIDHPDIIDRVKYGTQDSSANISTVSVPELQALWKIPRILIMDAIVNSADAGQANVHDFIGGKQALLVYSAPRPGLMVPSAGYDFNWAGLLGSVGGLGTRVSKFRMKALKSDRVEIEMAFDLKLVAADLGTLFLSAIA